MGNDIVGGEEVPENCHPTSFRQAIGQSTNVDKNSFTFFYFMLSLSLSLKIIFLRRFMNSLTPSRRKSTL